MTNYEKLVETLRWAANEYKGFIMDEYDKDTMNAAADAIEKLVTLYEKAEMDATNLTGKLAQAEADIERLNLEIDKRIATEIDLSNQVDALQAENPIVETVLVDKMRQQMEETVCHCNVKENAELIAKILDDDVDRKVFEMPKRCDAVEVVRCKDCKWSISCGYISTRSYAEWKDWFCADGEGGN